MMRDVLWASIQAQYDLHDDWQKKMCFEMMAELWRAGKSRLVKDIINAKNESERLALKLDCIKSDVEWRAFVAKKISKEHLDIRAKCQERRKKVVPHTLSRRGYAQTIDDMKENEDGKISRIDAFRRAHTKKNGEPVNPTTSDIFLSISHLIFVNFYLFSIMHTLVLLIYMPGSLNEILLEDPKSGTTDNADEDALTKLFGNPKSGRLIGQGRGVARSKLTVVNMCNSKISKLEEEQHNMKLEMTEMMNLLKEHLVVGGKVTPSEGQSRNVPQSNNIQSPKSIALEKIHNFTEGKNAC
ncbi:uncharacterized protein LOC133798352 isoform X3 [Humulus lupulus]|uniref:uncharacterized protein LOC133798352 isoform X3 n=1 Tax=Humulus lupulus TaxID=3486 RepID=UPI002B416942|nr:uncharacterized protein LOC133798352 isoform X3 [Humulus lupulus]